MNPTQARALLNLIADLYVIASQPEPKPVEVVEESKSDSTEK